jgi:anti-sigma B factor antagonist
MATTPDVPGRSDSDRTVEKAELTIRVEHDGDVEVMSLYGDLDFASVPALEEEWERLWSDGVEAVLIDLSGLQFMDSTGLRVLLEMVGETRGDGDRVRLLRGTHQVQELMELSGVDEMLPFLD